MPVFSGTCLLFLERNETEIRNVSLEKIFWDQVIALSRRRHTVGQNKCSKLCFVLTVFIYFFLEFQVVHPA